MYSSPYSLLIAGTVITSFYYAIIPASGNWLQTNQPDHESNDRALLLCVLPMKKKRYDISGAKSDQHLSLYCGSVKPKLQTGPGYWFL